MLVRQERERGRSGGDRTRRVLRHARLAFWLLIVGLALAAAWATRLGTRWPSVYTMTGPSMEPTLSAGEYFLAWSPVGEVERGDLVLFRFVYEGEEFQVLRRLVGLAGDTVSMDEGRAFINGEGQTWPYRVADSAAWRSPLAIGGHLFTWGPWVVPPDSVLLLADLRDILGWPDSRFEELGFVARDRLLARATRTIGGRRLE